MKSPRAARAEGWLKNQAIPLWSARGVDWEQGGFVENLSLEGQRIDGPKRTMVQARQIYSFRVAVEHDLLPQAEGARMIAHSADFLVTHAFSPSGAAYHSVTRDGKPENTMADLYAQGFVMFGLANAFALAKKPAYREKALGIFSYLKRERAASGGGFTENKGGKDEFQSNPHMHLFEAALAWMEVDQDPVWRDLADSLLKLCKTKFIDAETGLLAEHFDQDWNILRENGRFLFEPGHQFEWAWLIQRYGRLTRVNTTALAEQLFRNADQHGIFRPRNSASDEMWSDFTPKKQSARFWPQCERIKAAVRLGHQESADEAFDVLFRYFETKVPGLWLDTWAEDGRFSDQPVKASSLYHIIGALSEYLKTR